MSLFATARSLRPLTGVINGVNPDANLADLIGRIDELLPFAYVKNTPEKAVA